MINKPKTKALELATTAAVEYRGLLRSYLRRRLRKPDDLDDLAQEVYLRLLRIQDETQISRINKPMAYVYTVAANVMSDWIRASDRCIEQSVAIDAAEDELAGAAATPPQEDLTERLARQQHIERMLSQLPPIQAAALLLHARDGFSYEEIAGKLELSLEMVHYHLKRAKAKIRLSESER